ncbi:MAG: hypothetical protein E7K15_27920, partial [Klebsiella michiganensis]|nr:hypothetical protein [Klebsiella michiganensis]
MEYFLITDGSRERHITGRSECESGNREAFTASVIHRSGKTASMMMKTDADILTIRMNQHLIFGITPPYSHQQCVQDNVLCHPGLHG